MILIICNQSNVITSLKYKAQSLYFFNKIVLMYLKNLNLFKMGQHPSSGSIENILILWFDSKDSFKRI